MIETIQPYLYTFYLAGKHGSFTKAGQVLRILQSAVSMQIKKLEDVLQATLFFRQSRNKLSLTKIGSQLFATCSGNFEQLQKGLDSFQQGENEGALDISAPALFGAYILFPFLKHFKKTHPKITVSFQLSDDFIDPITDNIDIALRTTSKIKPNLNYEVIYDSPFCVVASKNYSINGVAVARIKNPAELSQFTFIIREPSHSVWNFWSKSIPRMKRPKIINSLLIDNNFTQIEAVKNNLGLGLFPMYAMKSGGHSQHLQKIFQQYKFTRPVYACTPKTLHKKNMSQVFVSELKTYIQKNFKDV